MSRSGPNNRTGGNDYDNEEERPLFGENGRIQWKHVFQVLTFLTALGALSAGIYGAVRPSEGRVRILHFSDFYQLQGVPDPSDPTSTIGGVSRLATFLKQERDKGTTLLVFGGDLFGPSAMSTLFGSPKQMVETFNLLEVDVAVAGNHEFDNGGEFASSQFILFDFPWLLSNLRVNTTKDADGEYPLIPGINTTQIISRGGINIAIIGLGFDYRTVTTLGNEYVYEDFVEACQREVKALEDGEEDVDFIIALTHMPLEDCQSILKTVPEINLLLTGHNHIWYYERVNSVPLVEGDINAEKVSVVDLSFIKGTYPLIHEIKVSFEDIDSTYPEDPDMAEVVKKYVDEFNNVGDTVIGRSLVTLVGEANAVRSSETNLGDFVADAQRNWTSAFLQSLPGFANRTDKNAPVISFINGGGLRWGYDKSPGDITDGDIYELLPFGNILNIIVVDGKTLKLALENAVSQYPAPAGKFLQISGFEFTFACTPLACAQPVGSRVLTITLPDNTPILDDTVLFLGLPDFSLEGGDDYTMFGNSEVIIGGDSGLDQFSIVRQAVADWQVISPAVDGRING